MKRFYLTYKNIINFEIIFYIITFTFYKSHVGVFNCATVDLYDHIILHSQRNI